MHSIPQRKAPTAPRLRIAAAVLAALALLVAVAACTDDTGADGDGALGSVRVAAGDAIQIRALLATSNEASGAFSNVAVVRLAVEQYGPIHGFDVHVGEAHNDYCSSAGGRGAGETIVTDNSVIGVIGTSCSVAAVEAASLLSEAGMALISPSSTSPALTSDLAGNPSEHHVEGFYRTAHNDLFQGKAVALFLRQEKGLRSAAVIHTGDVYTAGLAGAFVDAFEELGGEVTGSRVVSREARDVVPELTALAAGSPQALFLPVSQTVGESIVRQAPDVAGMEDVLLITGDGLIDEDYMGQPETEGMFFSGPRIHFGNNLNQSTSKRAPDVVAAFEEFFGLPPNSAFWGHAYDATTLLLEAIEAASRMRGDWLWIDRAEVRRHLDGVNGYSGLIGAITCDAFGDCGVGAVEIVEHLDATDVPASRDNVVYEYEP